MATKAKTTEKKSERSVITHEHARVLLRPRITEKASQLAGESNVYVFEVAQDVTKNDIMRAVQMFYKVAPVKVAIVPTPRKIVIVRGKKGITKSGKKAYVYLKKGDKIEFV